MAGVITHLVIAREMLKILPENTIRQEGLFYLGNLAPDAIHAREGYIRAHKKHTHFRDDIPDTDFEFPENYARYRERLAEFINKNRDRSDDIIDLYRGYVVHILTDELFVLTIRKEFCGIMSALGIGQNDRRFFDYIVADMNRNDMQLVYHYEGMDEIRRYMEEIAVCEVAGYISTQEMSISRDWLIHQHFILEQEELQPVYISYDRMLEFIQLAAREIVKRLSEGGDLPGML